MRQPLTTATEAARAASEAVRRAVPRRQKPSRTAVAWRAFRYPVLAGCGAVLAYFLDPVAGKRRRHVMADRSAAAVRRSRRRARAKTTYLEGRARGVVARASGKGRPHPVDDVEVKHQLEQALAREGLRRRDVLVDVCDGTATLRGQLSDEVTIARAEDAARDVPGVVELVSDLHLPGESPRHKLVAVKAS